MLHNMPTFVLQREVIGAGKMPREEGEVHREPRNWRISQLVSDAFQRARTKERGKECAVVVFAEGRGEEERQEGRIAAEVERKTSGAGARPYER